MKNAFCIIIALFFISNISFAQTKVEKEVVAIFFKSGKHKIVATQDDYHIWNGKEGKAIYKAYQKTTHLTISVNGEIQESYNRKLLNTDDTLFVPIFLNNGDKVAIIISRRGDEEFIDIIRGLKKLSSPLRKPREGFLYIKKTLSIV